MNNNHSNKPYIMIVGETLGLGGAEKVTVDMANALHKSGLYRVAIVTTLTSGGVFRERLQKDIPVLEVHEVASADEMFNPALIDEREKAFIELVASERPDGLLLNNCRLAQNCIGRILERHKPDCLSFFIHGFSRWSMDLLPDQLPEGAHVLTISKESAEGILHQRPDIARPSVGVLSNCIDTKRFAPLAKGDKPTVPAWDKDSGPIFGYAGRFSGEKGLITMVDIFRRVKKRLPKARLLLVGGCDPGVPVHEAYWKAERSAVEQAIKQMGLLDSVQITGVVDKPEDYYHMMDVFLLTSHFEGVPLVILEAMACGLPVVATAVGAIPRLLKNGCGAVVAKQGLDLNDVERDYFVERMVEISTSPELLKMGVMARNRIVRSFSMSRYEKSVLDYFLRRVKR